MVAVKKSIIELEKLLSIDYDPTLLSDEYIAKVTNSYDKVISTCNDYINNKHPFFSKGIERKRLVQEHKEVMEKEKLSFVQGADIVKKRFLEPYIDNTYDLMCVSKIQEISERTAKENNIRISVQYYNVNSQHKAELSPEFENVCNTLSVINMFLKEPFPMISAIDTTSEVDELSFITMKQNRLLYEIDACIETKCNGNTDLINQLKVLRQQCVEDQEFMQTKVENYRVYLKDHPDEAAKATWKDALGFIRSVAVDTDDKKKCKTDVMGDCTSVVYRLEDIENKKVVFFQEKQFKSLDSKYVDDYLSMFPEVNNAFIKQMYKEVLDGYYYYCSGNGGLEEIYSNMQGYTEAYKKREVELAHHILKSVNLPPSYVSDVALLGKMLSGFSTFIAQQIISSQAGISAGNTLTGRNVAASRLAKLLGFGGISESRSAVIRRNGQFLKGNIMDDSDGDNIVDIGRKHGADLQFDDQAVSDLMDLRVFDFICGQVDRHNGNIHFNYKNGSIVGVKGIDNDMCFGEYTYDDITNSAHNHQTKFDPLLLDGLSDNFIRQLDSLSRPLVDALLSDILTKKELDALWSRISGIQNELRKKDALLKAAKNKEENADIKKKKQYFRQYQALYSIKLSDVDDDNAFSNIIFTSSYINEQGNRLRKQLNSATGGKWASLKD